MTRTRTPTGGDLPEGFIERYSGRMGQRSSLFGLMRSGLWELSAKAGTEPATTFYSGERAGTVALHAREGIHTCGLLAGIVTGGTGSDVVPWTEELQGRGEIIMLDARRVREDGVLIRVVNLTPSDAIHVLDSEERAAEDAENWRAIKVGAIAARWGQDLASDPINTDEANEGSEAPRGERELTMEAMARAMTSVPAAIPVGRPEVPELTDRSVENAKRLFALTAGQLADLFGVTERQMRRYLAEGGLPENRRTVADALAAIGLTVVGGLGPNGARAWLFSGDPTGADLVRASRIAELTERAEALRDSPFT